MGSDDEEGKQIEESKKGEGNEEAFEGDVFNQEQNNDLIDDATEQDFQCINPQNPPGQKHIVYTCKGVDSNGAWEGPRRFSEFYKLHEKLTIRWPGIPIPELPPKKSIGNKDIKFINERRFYLERFLKKMAQFPFMLESPEF